MIFSQHVDYAFSGAVAYKYGIQAAMVINRIIFAINYHQERAKQYGKKYFLEDHWWMDDSHESLSNHFNGLIAAETIRKLIRKMEKDGLLISKKRKATFWDQTKWYTISGVEWDALHGKPAENSNRDNIPDQTGIPDRIKPVSEPGSSSSNSLTNSLTNLSQARENLNKVPEGFEEYQPIMDALAVLGPKVTLETVMATMAEFYIEPHTMEKITTGLRGHYAGRNEAIRKPVECFKSWVMNYLNKHRAKDWLEIVAARNKERQEREEIEF